MTEKWKPISGFEGRYEVSDRGRVKSLERVVVAKDRYGNLTAFHRKESMMQIGPHSGGYRMVRLGIDQRAFTIHRLVTEVA